MIKFFVSIAAAYLYNYNSEIFPTRLRGFTFSIALGFGRILTALTPFVIDLADSLRIHSLCFVLITAVPCLIIIRYMPETKNKKLEN